MKKFTKIGLTIWLVSVCTLGLLYLLGLAIEGLALDIGGIKRLKGDTLFCFDISGSMAGVLDEYSSELEFFIRIVPPGTRMGLRTFGGFNMEGTKLEVPVDSYTRKKIKKWLKGDKRAGGGTPMDLALTASIEDFPRDAKRKNLVLVTDGMPNDFEKTCEAAKLVKKKGIGLYYILVMEQYQDLENLEKLVDDCGKGKIIAIKARDFGNWLQLAFGNYFYFLVVLLITMLTVYASYHQARFLSHLLPIYLPGAIPLTVVSKVSFSFWIVFTLVILVGLFHIIGWKLGTILIAVSMVVIVVIGLFTNRF